MTPTINATIAARRCESRYAHTTGTHRASIAQRSHARHLSVHTASVNTNNAFMWTVAACSVSASSTSRCSGGSPR